MRYQLLLNTSFLGFCILLGGCATPSTSGDRNPNQTTLDLSNLISQGNEIESSGNKAAAITKFEEAARFYPSAKLPWIRIAQIQFGSQNYGEAIVAAQQIIARDEKDKIAQSILSVSGLRVSTKALADLGYQNELDGSVKSEAQNLARLIRESLGEKVLVPPAATDASRANVPGQRSSSIRPGTSPAKPVQATPPSVNRNANPFGVLK